MLLTQTPSGPGWYRHGVKASGRTDGYGDCYEPNPTNCSPTGAPWFPTGLALDIFGRCSQASAPSTNFTALARRALGAGNRHARMSWGLGLEPEQAWEDPNYPPSPYGSDPTTAPIGFINGKAARFGRAADLGPRLNTCDCCATYRPGRSSTSRPSSDSATLAPDPEESCR